MDRDEACTIYRLLVLQYPRKSGDENFILFENPFQVLVLTILSAQTTDRTVNQIRTSLFLKYPAEKDLARARPEDVEALIRSSGFFRTKARNIIAAAQKIVADFGGEVPKTMEELLMLPGVGRKTANIVLHHAFGINAGIAVDTHVARVSRRIGLSDATTPGKIEQDLTAIFSASVWGDINYLMIRHGREVCTARRPRCDVCVIRQLCRYYLERQEGRAEQDR
ncbi:MAG: endonuclease III [Methanomicrobiaceae archaeon]|uniref:Endonuclease iii n=1 Tax=hydrocarbon metagenome TaxID=938273 RepID=A0A0W8FH12_9ZZZZ|nr:endonuclease III [Methanomicrobiaceae archaeon]MDD5419039.1 endonuclease III [Methanomicrobiaceae archaeon]